MNPDAWIGCGFTATSENVHIEHILPMGCIRIVCPQIAWGTGYPRVDPDGSHAARVIREAREAGLDVAGWAWCDGQDVEGEARRHVQAVTDLGLNKFIANCEEPYDAHGDVSSPRFSMCNRYMDVFRSLIPEWQCELGLTTTPRWASDGTGARQAGCTMMPQCFSLEVTDGTATIAAAVPFMESWGWPKDRQRPLVQVYPTNGSVPDPQIYNNDSYTYGVGVVPYILEQATPGAVEALSESVLRVSAGDTPLPPDPMPPESKPPDLPFQRALYPPDSAAQGKSPSKPGPDVKAVKRAISRMGLWTWQEFDENYSNSFSHGSSKNGPGVAEFQERYVACQPTGWYGGKTHEVLRTSKIPKGLPHAGEWAFDGTAINLYRQA
jgi:hypothetical protein